MASEQSGIGKPGGVSQVDVLNDIHKYVPQDWDNGTESAGIANKCLFIRERVENLAKDFKVAKRDEPLLMASYCGTLKSQGRLNESDFRKVSVELGLVIAELFSPNPPEISSVPHP